MIPAVCGGVHVIPATRYFHSQVRAVRGDAQLLSPYTCDTEDGYDTLAITNGLSGSLGEKRVLQVLVTMWWLPSGGCRRCDSAAA